MVHLPEPAAEQVTEQRTAWVDLEGLGGGASGCGHPHGVSLTSAFTGPRLGAQFEFALNQGDRRPSLIRCDRACQRVASWSEGGEASGLPPAPGARRCAAGAVAADAAQLGAADPRRRQSLEAAHVRSRSSRPRRPDYQRPQPSLQQLIRSGLPFPLCQKETELSTRLIQSQAHSQTTRNRVRTASQHDQLSLYHNIPQDARPTP